jgi:putative flippase GtrA
MLLTPDRLPQGERVEALKFCLVGAGGYAVNTCAFALSVALGSQELLAAAAAFGAAVAVNFWCNRRWTFAATHGSPGGQAARFLLVSLGAFAFGAAVLELLSGPASIPALPAQAASIVAATPLNFLGNKAWSFAA